MKVMWLLVVVCVLGCGAKTPTDGLPNTPSDTQKVDTVDAVADRTGEIGPDAKPVDTIVTTRLLDVVDTTDTIALPDSRVPLDVDVPCVPDCGGKECGGDGCGGQCGVCEDGDPCTEDSCDAGMCINAEFVCDDGDLCTADHCGPGGECQHLPLEEGAPCGQGGPWTCIDAICTCTPTTCAALAYECGAWDDSCGGSLSCGVCPPQVGCNAGACTNTCQPELLGAFGGEPQALALDDGVAWVAADAYAMAFDVSDPEDIQLMGLFDPKYSVYVVAIADGRAFFATGIGIRVLEIDAAGAVAFVGSSQILLHPTDVTIQDDRLYLADLNYGLTIFDISNPAAPQLLGMNWWVGNALSIDLQGDLAYVVEMYQGLHVVDVSDPAAPILVGFQALEGEPEAVKVVGDHALVVGDPFGLLSLDISDPEAISVSAQVVDPFWPHGKKISVEGDLAYVLRSGNIDLLDVSDPASPVLLETYPFGGFASDIRTAGGVAVVAQMRGLKTLDVSNPVAVQELDEFQTPGDLSDLEVIGDLVYAAGFYHRVVTMDATTPQSLEILGTASQGGGPLDIQVSGGIAFVTTNYETLYSIDVSDLAAPVEIGALDLPGDRLWAVALHGDYVLVAADDGGLHVVDASDPAAMTLVTTIVTASDVYDVECAGGRAFAALDGGDVIALDLGDPASPLLMTSIPAVWPAALRVHAAPGGDLVLAFATKGMAILDASDPADLQVMGNWSQGAGWNWSVREARVVGSVAYLAGDYHGLAVVDLSDPSLPQFLASMETPDSATDLRVVGDLLYLTCSSGGLQVFDVSSCQAP